MNPKSREKRTKSEQRQRPQSADRSRFISYHASRQQLDERRTLERKANIDAREQTKSKIPGKRVSGRIFYGAVSGLLIVAILYSLSLASSARLSITNPVGVPLIRSRQTYDQAISAALQKSLLRKNKLTIDTQEVSAEIRNQFPEFEAVEVVLPFMGRKPIVDAVTTKPAIYLKDSNTTYIISGKGRVVLPVQEAQPAARALAIPTVTDRAELEVKAGKAVLSQQDVTFITTVYQQLKAKNISVSSMELPPLATELHVRMTDTPYYVKFSLLTDPRIVVGQYLALRQKLEKNSIRPSEYVDSRVEEKIYYK